MSTGKSTWPEAAIVIATLVVCAAIAYNGGFQSWSDIGKLATFLAIFVGFYFFLLLARAIHGFMAGNDGYWWEKYKEEHQHMQEKARKK